MCRLALIVESPAVDLKSAAELFANLSQGGKDGCGIAALVNDGKTIKVRKWVRPSNKVPEEEVKKALEGANMAILHARQATCGGKDILNTHPLISGHVVLAHNGIVQDHVEAKITWAEQYKEDHRSYPTVDSYALTLPLRKGLLEGVAGLKTISWTGALLAMSTRSPGVALVVAHNKYLDALKEGDRFVITTDASLYTPNYKVTQYGDLKLWRANYASVELPAGVYQVTLKSIKKISDEVPSKPWQIHPLPKLPRAINNVAKSKDNGPTVYRYAECEFCGRGNKKFVMEVEGVWLCDMHRSQFV